MICQSLASNSAAFNVCVKNELSSAHRSKRCIEPSSLCRCNNGIEVNSAKSGVGTARKTWDFINLMVGFPCGLISVMPVEAVYY